MDTRINTDVKIQYNKPDIFILDKVKKEITLIEVGITSQDNLQTVESDKLWKYDLLANELGLMYKCRTRMISYVLTWDGVVTTYHKKYVQMLALSTSTEAYIQSRVLKKTLESISLDYRRGIQEGGSSLEDGEMLASKLCSNVERRYSATKI